MKKIKYNTAYASGPVPVKGVPFSLDETIAFRKERYKWFVVEDVPTGRWITFIDTVNTYAECERVFTSVYQQYAKRKIQEYRNKKEYKEWIINGEL